MFQLLKNRSKKIKGRYLFAVLLVLLVLTPQMTHAAIIDIGKIVTDWILGGIFGIFGAVINFEGLIISKLVGPGALGLAFVTNAGVITGWKIIRDLVNLGFVLAIIVIAIGFILRLQTYGSTRTLSRLIIAAILVNFSLTIAGIFIDSATVLSSFFLKDFSFDNLRATFSNNLSAVIVSANKDNIIKAIGEGLVSGVVLILIQILLVAVLAALIVMLLYRIGNLWFLLILAPAAWFSWIFPALEGNWKKWWKQFLDWTFFAPFVLFFLYVSLQLLNAYSSYLSQQQGSGNFIDLLAQYFLTIMLIVMSMIVAKDMSITFADTGVKWATMTKWPKTAIGRAVGREGGRRFSTSGIGKALEERLSRSRIPGFGGVADRIRGMRTDVGEDATKLAGRYQGMTSSTILSDLSDPTRRKVMSQAEILARAKVVNDRGDRLPQDLAGTVLQLAHNVNPKLAESFMPANPELVDYYERDIARRPEGKRRTITDYSARMTPEQAAAISIDRLNAMTDQQRMQFALGVRQSVLASLFDSKNSAAADRIVAEISKTNEELKTAGISDAEIKRAKNMLKSPNISVYVGAEAKTSPIIIATR